MRHLLLPLLSGVTLCGCYGPKPLVSVDLPDLKQTPQREIKAGGAKPTHQPVTIAQKKTIPTLPNVIVSTDKRGQQDVLRQQLDRESNLAIQLISDRLKEFYQKEINSFYESEVDKIGIKRSEITEKFKNLTRVIFEKYAIQRAPLVTRLTFLTDFPHPKELLPLDADGLADREKKRRTEVRDIQRNIFKLDAEYDKEIATVEESLRGELGAQAEVLSESLERKQEEISQRSLQEASRQVRRFGEAISSRLFPDTAEKLPSVPGATAEYATAKASGAAPVVTFTEDSSISTKALLENELNMWLSLNRYELAEAGPGVRDATEEFLKWRKSLSPTSARSENLRKP